MKIGLALCIFGFTGMAFAGGHMGGGGPPALSDSNILSVGDIQIDLPAIDEGSSFFLDETKMFDVLGGTMRNDPIILNGEKFTPDRYEFEIGQMVIRSVTNPSKTVILKKN